jgi:hypothetical protein
VVIHGLSILELVKMAKFKINFRGREKGAIGQFHECTEIVEADNLEQAFLKLYDKYDSVQLPGDNCIEEGTTWKRIPWRSGAY